MKDDDILRMIDDTIRDTSVSPDAARQRQRPVVAIDPSPRRTGFVRTVAVELTPEQRAEKREMILAMFREIGAHLHQEIERFVTVAGQYVEHVHRQLFTSGLIPPSPSADPMLAVIEARRHRNTGPKRPLRAPQTINPRRTR